MSTPGPIPKQFDKKNILKKLLLLTHISFNTLDTIRLSRLFYNASKQIVKELKNDQINTFFEFLNKLQDLSLNVRIGLVSIGVATTRIAILIRSTYISLMSRKDLTLKELTWLNIRDLLKGYIYYNSHGKIIAKNTPPKDYHAILGVSKKASLQEIKKAYRKESLKNHPDKNIDKLQSHIKMIEINEAYKKLTSK